MRPPVTSSVFRSALAGVALAVTVAACSPQIATHGNMVDVDALAKIEPGRTPQSEVLALLGSPSSQANFGEPTWYYIGQLTERQAFYRPETIERRVVYVDFEPAGTVKSIGTLDLEDGKKIAIVDRETPTAGQRITLLKQLIGNVGRFSPTD
ncbi:outer membrane protein assembly factor BamE [Thalassobaculum sp. OXR-137]|uniref:outer membrane protein assembly factor BamE n=1 Tax=Thalassobaculum sp. OXR-137 TaxID=3100173 RepID=UPI002AC8CAE4|nr:outer membrane protein assembly factor BamE [Thalassobaculum sp. OXR-137]WPZ33267.1 outer membrane protein assembly factor BamE [Thalassobaculum sp. OXR-137]